MPCYGVLATGRHALSVGAAGAKAPGGDPSQSAFYREITTLPMMISAQLCAKDQGTHSMTPMTSSELARY